nr:sugar transferase [Schaedlerella arabinosiphila]
MGEKKLEEKMRRFQRKISFYEKYVKRGADIICAATVLLCFGWLYIIIAFLVKINLGSPIIFKQPRPGLIDSKSKQEKIFFMYKFRTMTDERDCEGKILSDEQRLTRFGRILRSTSLDELPEIVNILKGDMSLVGPRPQLVRDMVFMTDEQRMRHTARPGLSGLAQVNGRNAISWEDKLEYDLQYIKKINFWGDIKIILKTIVKVFIKKNDYEEETFIVPDFGDWLLQEGKITNEEYNVMQNYAKNLLGM